MVPVQSYTVLPTLNKTHECQIIRKIFSNRENTDKAIEAFKDWNVPPQDARAVLRFEDDQIIGRDYQECHDSAQRWLADWANIIKYQPRQMVVPLLRNVPAATRAQLGAP